MRRCLMKAPTLAILQQKDCPFYEGKALPFLKSPSSLEAFIWRSGDGWDPMQGQQSHCTDPSALNLLFLAGSDRLCWFLNQKCAVGGVNCSIIFFPGCVLTLISCFGACLFFFRTESSLFRPLLLSEDRKSVV